MMYNTVSKLCFAQFEKVKLVEEEFSKFAFLITLALKDYVRNTKVDV